MNQIAELVYSCTNQIAALVNSCTNQIAALEYVYHTEQIAVVVYSCTKHRVRELLLMLIMSYNDWLASKISLAVFRF